MKKFQIIVLMTILTFNSFGQSFRAMVLNPNVYRTKVDITAIRLIDRDLNVVYNDTIIIKVSDLGYLDYKIVNEDENGYVIIRVLPKVKIFNERSQDSSKIEKVVRFTTDSLDIDDDNNAYKYYFAIKKDGFKPLSKTILSTKIVGIPLIQPFKLRPSKGGEGWNLGGEFTVSYSFGIRIKLGKNPFSQTFLSLVPYGFGIGASKYFKKNADETLTEKVDAFAVTYFQGGLLLTVEKINFGIFTGFDAMIDKQNDWFYQGKPWLSFGLGYKFKND